jgi:hypothetical protein
MKEDKILHTHSLVPLVSSQLCTQSVFFFVFGCRAGVVASMAPTTTTDSHNSSDAKPDLDVRVNSSNARNKERRTELYPHIKYFNSGYLPVSKLHTLYWEESGNPTGQVSRRLVHDQKKEMDQKKGT